MKLKILPFIIFTCILTACNEKTTQPNQQQRPPTKVSTLTIKQEPIEITSDLTGRVASSMVSQVRPQVAGIILNRYFEEGSKVTKGQILYQIDPAQYKASYNQAQAAVNSAKADISSAKSKYERYKELVNKKAIAKQDAEDAKASYEKLQATYEEKKAALELARINLNYTKIVAPISGIIGISTVTPGALVTANQVDSLATIRALDPVYIDMTRSSAEALKIKEIASKLGDTQTAPVSLFLENGKEYPEKGLLKLSEVSVDESTGSVTLRAVFKNTHNILLPGMYVKAKLVNGVEEKGIAIPQLTTSQNAYGDSFVFVVDKDNKVEKRKISIYGAYNNKWIVQSGLQVGEQIVTEGTDKIANGQTVVIDNNKGN